MYIGSDNPNAVLNSSFSIVKLPPLSVYLYFFTHSIQRRTKKVNYLKSKQLLHVLNTTVIENLDFEDFLNKYKPLKDDFVFFDPPYDSEFSTYTQNKFGKEDQERLSNYLINDCKSHWMLVIKNTKYIENLYSKKGLFIKSFDKTYLVSFMNRNEKNTEHLLITNYKRSAYDN